MKVIEQCIHIAQERISERTGEQLDEEPLHRTVEQVSNAPVVTFFPTRTYV